MARKNVLIMGAAGRDFHNFNVMCRDNEDFEVVAFTATQIPGIDDRRYPAALAGPRYPDGIPIHAQDALPRLIRELGAEGKCVLVSSHILHEVEQMTSTIMLIQNGTVNHGLLGQQTVKRT